MSFDIESQEKDEALWREVFARQLDALSRQVSVTSDKVDENTATTQKIEKATRELMGILESFRGAMSVLDTMGKVVKPIAAFVTLVAGIVSTWYTFKGSK